MRRTEPEHLGLPPRGAFRRRSRNGATLRLHLGHKALARTITRLPAGYTCKAEPSGGFWGELAVVARLP
jgi:hypothetical protein